ncbi:MAG: hypothetical protein ACREUA_02865, partial [Burkholderiales bacterium]
PKQTLNMVKTVLKAKDVFIDEKLNLLIMRDTPQSIRLAEKLIATQDLADPEVLLEVEVLEVSRNRLLELGIRYPDQITASVVGRAGVAGQITLGEVRNDFNSDLVRLTITNPAAILNLRQQDSDVDLLANPRIRVKNREKATVHIGERVPVITSTATSTGFVSENVSYIDVGLKLEVEPNVYLQNDVSIKVALEVSNIVQEIRTSSGTVAFRLGTRNATTTLRVQDGETQILAGLINDEERRTADKLPGLGDLPLIGRLFSSHLTTDNRTEIVLLITPRVVRNLVRPGAVFAEFMSGTEGSVGAKSLSLTPAGPPPARQPSQGASTPQDVPPGPALPSPQDTRPAAPAPTTGTPPAGTVVPSPFAPGLPELLRSPLQPAQTSAPPGTQRGGTPTPEALLPDDEEETLPDDEVE